MTPPDDTPLIALYQQGLTCGAIAATLERPAGTVRSRVYALQRAQANWMAWRLVREWVLAQFGLIEARLATVEQGTLPYGLTGNGHTVYERWGDGRFVLPAGTEDPRWSSVIAIATHLVIVLAEERQLDAVARFGVVAVGLRLEMVPQRCSWATWRKCSRVPRGARLGGCRHGGLLLAWRFTSPHGCAPAWARRLCAAALERLRDPAQVRRQPPVLGALFQRLADLELQHRRQLSAEPPG
jgi:hypothetical protein